MAGAREWDATTYDRVAAPMTLRGTALVDRIPLAPDAWVVDAGCGTGRVTAALLARVPRGRVWALDGSRAMLDEARARLGDDPRVAYVQADLTRPLPLPAPVDAVVSTSTFHWVHDHPALFGRLAAVLVPGGMLAADFGGDGNVAVVVAALEDLGESTRVWNFPALDATVRDLEAAGFAVEDARTVRRPHRLDPGGALQEYLRTVVLGAHLLGRPPEDADRLVREVAAHLPGGEIDYVRTEVVARLRA